MRSTTVLLFFGAMVLCVSYVSCQGGGGGGGGGGGRVKRDGGGGGGGGGGIQLLGPLGTGINIGGGGGGGGGGGRERRDIDDDGPMQLSTSYVPGQRIGRF